MFKPHIRHIQFYPRILNNGNMSKPLLLAPMAELSHRALRELIEGFKPGADDYFSEMISAGALVSGGPFEKWYTDKGPCPEKLVYQLVGGNEDHLCQAAALLDRENCLGIDINMGCSAPAITRTGAGVQWMACPDKAGALIRKIRPLVSRRLSVKLRAGLEDNSPTILENLVLFCRRLEEEGVDLITLHPRTSREKFKRKARWEYISALRKELRIPLAGNGDISSAGEILSRSRVCDAVMIGRLAVRQPWVFSEARRLEKPSEKATDSMSEDGMSEDLVKETGLRFLELLAKYQPPEFHLSRAKRFFSYFCDNLFWGNHVKNLINRESDLAGIERAWALSFPSCLETTIQTTLWE